MRDPQASSKLSLGVLLVPQASGVCSYLAPHISALGPQLVDLGLGDVRPLLSFLKLVLDPPAPGQLRVGLLLLKGRWRYEVTEPLSVTLGSREFKDQEVMGPGLPDSREERWAEFSRV